MRVSLLTVHRVFCSSSVSFMPPVASALRPILSLVSSHASMILSVLSESSRCAGCQVRGDSSRQPSLQAVSARADSMASLSGRPFGAHMARSIRSRRAADAMEYACLWPRPCSSVLSYIWSLGAPRQRGYRVGRIGQDWAR